MDSGTNLDVKFVLSDNPSQNTLRLIYEIGQCRITDY